MPAPQSPAAQETDPWLDRLLPLVAARIREGVVLELGCGRGRDTRVLARAGLRVVALDRSSQAIAHARVAAPDAEFHCLDIRDPWPTRARSVDVVVASLSLHYFAWDETCALVERIRTVLADGGLLLCRLNSTNDQHYGAMGHPRIDADYYLVDGQPKRFFDRAAVDALFASGWNTLEVEERVVARYGPPKSLWEIVAEPVVRTQEANP